jgi:hypothetical protein
VPCTLTATATLPDAKASATTPSQRSGDVGEQDRGAAAGAQVVLEGRGHASGLDGAPPFRVVAGATICAGLITFGTRHLHSG